MGKIWYHGTNEENAERILINGFKEGTFFAKHLEDAVGYGGEYVFEVYLTTSCEYWEYVSDDIVSTENIVGLKKYSRIIKLENGDLRKKIFEENLNS